MRDASSVVRIGARSTSMSVSRVRDGVMPEGISAVRGPSTKVSRGHNISSGGGDSMPWPSYRNLTERGVSSISTPYPSTKAGTKHQRKRGETVQWRYSSLLEGAKLEKALIKKKMASCDKRRGRVGAALKRKDSMPPPTDPCWKVHGTHKDYTAQMEAIEEKLVVLGYFVEFEEAHGGREPTNAELESSLKKTKAKLESNKNRRCKAFESSLGRCRSEAKGKVREKATTKWQAKIVKLDAEEAVLLQQKGRCERMLNFAQSHPSAGR